MEELVRWLGACLDEDERRAQRGYYSDTHWERFTTEAHLHAWKAWREYFPREQWDVKANDAVSEAARDGIRERITAHEKDRSARMLREIDAKRQIIREWEDAKRTAEDDPSDVSARVALLAFGVTLRLHAAVYADRPGYREEWRP